MRKCFQWRGWIRNTTRDSAAIVKSSQFLDEGFATLDPDTLEITLSVLDALNASGKMIGNICHVDALTERIPTQIRVETGGGVGYSKLVF